MPSYDAAFWGTVVDRASPGRLMGTLHRLVENQGQKVTVRLTDNLAEHEVLEAMIEASKPSGAPRPGLERLDYLLRTPWRYPPLPWGSRFGTRFEPSLFYGALSHLALFAEAAYYRFVFLAGMVQPFSDRVINQFTVFDATYRTGQGLDLTQAPFARHESALRHPADYGPCQALGAVLRDRGIAAVVYRSARSRQKVQNVALFSPLALRSRKHRNPRTGVCESRTEQVSFRFGAELFSYPREDFLVDGNLPVPA